jgi:hypothetical protein
MKTEPASKTSFLRNQTMDKFEKRETVAVNFIHGLFSLLFTYGNLVMQSVVWLLMFRFELPGLEQSGSVLHTQISNDLTY